MFYKKAACFTSGFFFPLKLYLLYMKSSKNLLISYQEYLPTELTEKDAELYTLAKKAATTAYAPYSKFNVGCAIRLKSGQIVTGSNQENAAFPSGLCAERVAFFYTGANYPADQIETVAISVLSDKKRDDLAYAPCAACRQAMLEYENKQSSPIRILFEGANNSIIEMHSLKDLIPFSFVLEA